MTPECTKMILQSTRSKKGKEIRKYFIEIERLLYKYKNYIIYGLNEKIVQLENNQKPKIDLIRKIKKIFGNDPIICYGYWSIGKHMRWVISTPNLGLKKISEHFIVYNLDEFRTLMLNYNTEDKNENLYLPDKKKVVRKLHSVLTFQTKKTKWVYKPWWKCSK